MRWLLLFVALLTTGCYRSGISSASIMTAWTSEEGYSITLMPDGSYRFCDRGNCFTDRYERPGAPEGLAVTLKNIFGHAQARRFYARLRELSSRGGIFDSDYPDLDFTVNSGVGGAPGARECDYKPCVFFGEIETNNNLHFLREVETD